MLAEAALQRQRERLCLGGKLAFLTGCRTDVDCSVCYYGVGIEKNLDEIGNIKRPMVMHFAELDKFSPPEAVVRIKAASGGRPDIQIYEYPGVDHAFARSAETTTTSPGRSWLTPARSHSYDGCSDRRRHPLGLPDRRDVTRARQAGLWLPGGPRCRSPQ